MSIVTIHSDPGVLDKIRADLHDKTVCLALHDAAQLCEALRVAMPFLVAEAAKQVLEQAVDAQTSAGPCDSYSYKFQLADSTDRIRRQMESLIASKSEKS